jgi:hypothetical protein
MAQSPSVPNRVVKVTVSEEVFQDLRGRAFEAELPIASYVRRLVERHCGSAPRRSELAVELKAAVLSEAEKRVAVLGVQEASKAVGRSVEPRFKK